MRSLFQLVGFIVVVFFGAGWYFGWYSFNWSRTADGKTDVQFKVDNGKVIDDIKKGGEKVGNLIDGLKTKTQPQDPGFMGPPAPMESSGTKAPNAANLPLPNPGKK
ncbi:MAG: hypothetical protein ACRCZF_12835 [Gemmataceae bacterium]